MRILITGASGFVGQELAGHLAATMPDAVLHGTTLDINTTRPDDDIHYHEVDLKHPEAVHALINDLKPDHVYHLAAQAFVPRSFEAPWETLENNIRGQLNLIQASIHTDVTPRMLVVSSAEIYGPINADDMPITEHAELRPTSPYSVSKVTQDMLAFQYANSHDLPIMRARPFNHIGPGQNATFVAPAFALQIARIENGLQAPTLYVGDLSARRDFTDVRDIVRAYRFIMEKGLPGDVYNVASGQARSVRSLLDGLLALTDVEITVKVDESRLRPTRIPVLQGSYAHLNAVTGWEPTISFEQSLRDIMDDCRRRVGEGPAR